VTSERRYSETEIAAIFERAAESQAAGSAQPSGTGGMTLAQLQEIGRDVGIPPELVSAAARSLDRPVEADRTRSFLGFPIGVGRTVELGRKLTDEEWERLVVELREVFDARGVVRQEGTLRQWTNGNLQVLLEPGASGHRVRFRTTKSDAPSTITLATLAAAGGAFGLLSLALGAADRWTDVIVAPVVAFLAGGAGLAYLAYRLPRWARERTRQMAAIAERLLRP